ncbi:Hypothetical predicted protein, partial [Paramuricea clavata]
CCQRAPLVAMSTVPNFLSSNDIISRSGHNFLYCQAVIDSAQKIFSSFSIKTLTTSLYISISSSDFSITFRKILLTLFACDRKWTSSYMEPIECRIASGYIPSISLQTCAIHQSVVSWLLHLFLLGEMSKTVADFETLLTSSKCIKKCDAKYKRHTKKSLKYFYHIKPSDIANRFCKYFANIGPDLATKAPGYDNLSMYGSFQICRTEYLEFFTYKYNCDKHNLVFQDATS